MIEKENHHVLENWVLFLSFSGNTTRLKSMSKGRLLSTLKLATEEEKHHVMEAWVLCLRRSGNTTRLKSISKNRLSSELILATEKERLLTTET